MLEVKVWADAACFTRPESKGERVTYDVMTPSAARGVLEAIFWRPQFRWQVREIVVLKPIRRMSILRNEVNSTASLRTVRSWQKKGGHYRADADRAQRHAVILRDVEYIIRAEIRLRPYALEPVEKFREMFERRVRKGQARHQPYLGSREFSAFFSPVEGTEQPIGLTEDLGRMLLDLEFIPAEDGNIAFTAHERDGDSIAAKQVRGIARPRFFDARLERGVLKVPDYASEEVV